MEYHHPRSTQIRKIYTTQHANSNIINVQRMNSPPRAPMIFNSNMRGCARLVRYTTMFSILLLPIYRTEPPSPLERSQLYLSHYPFQRRTPSDRVDTCNSIITQNRLRYSLRAASDTYEDVTSPSLIVPALP